MAPGGGQQMVPYPGYMAYGYKSPNMEEAKEQQMPIGVDPTEENVIGSWDDLEYRDHIYAFNEEYAKAQKRHRGRLRTAANVSVDQDQTVSIGVNVKH